MWLFNHCEDMRSHHVHLWNSPQYHMALFDVQNVHIHSSSIIVDIVKQRSLLKSGGFLDNTLGTPTFPLNTDGIDIQGQNVLVENVYIENFDDTVVPKPSHQNQAFFTDCTQNITVRNCQVKYGVGMSIGSVPPRAEHNCVRNVLFDTIDFDLALKVVYVKSNPGTEGTGIIENITYRNLRATRTLWMPIWIGPQQQRQRKFSSDAATS